MICKWNRHHFKPWKLIMEDAELYNLSEKLYVDWVTKQILHDSCSFTAYC